MPYFLREPGRQAEGGRRDLWFGEKEEMKQSYGRLAGGRENGDVRRQPSVFGDAKDSN